MKNLMIAIFLSILAGGCNGQVSKAEKNKKEIVYKAGKDTLKNAPKTDVRVNKKYDDKGNLIQYDSTYSWYYHSPAGSIMHIESDSLYGNFRSFFQHRYDTLMNQNLNDIFFTDSLFGYDFFNPDYFLERYRLNMQKFENMFRQMDSLKMGYINRDYPKGNLRKNK